MRLKDLDEALKDANKSIELGGEFYSYVTRGEIFMAMNNYIDAINDFTQAISYNPNSIETLEYRAKCYRKLAETEQDPAKKADLIAKAKADEKIVKSLKKKKKSGNGEK
ncbi:TPR repeat-containing protein [Prevotella sp. khp7]|nr:TPR repeat-containing protein [Prevotella sp. khp7]